MSDQPDLIRIEALFQQAADLPAAEREAFLDRECGDPDLREHVERLLGRMEEDGSLGSPALAAPLSEGPGTVIDRYRLQQKLGEGGYGVVYMAEQFEPVRRQVALKIIKLGMDSAEVVARFDAERQALALMDHPNIAKVLDGGTTETGRPYFVMELVRGVAVTEYCNTNRLSTEERLGLFETICHAVQHAHQKGVIHRDIKPSNVMVTLHDGKPVPKVIDFGVAKAIAGPLTDKTLFTAYQRFIGTPAYMSPEQAEMSGLGVDTRTDIYSLGVLLYELLTGTTPFDSRALLEEGLLGIQRVLREREPDRPSLRISTTADATIAQQRRVDVTALTRELRGDLDWIVMKALEKDRSRRYESASEMAADVRRHLEDVPVLAGPPSNVYRMRKFLARNRTAAIWSCLVLLALVGGIVGTTLAMIDADRQRDEARREAERSLAVTDFLVETLALADPEIALDPEASVSTLLRNASSQLETTLTDQPNAEARVRATIGRAFASLGENELAEIHLRRAVELTEAMETYDAVEHYTTLWALTNVLFRLERPDALSTAQHARRVAHAHVRSRVPRLADALDRFVHAIDEAAQSPEPQLIAAAMPLFDETVRLSEELVPAGDPMWELIAGSYMHAGYDLWYGPHEAASPPFWRRVLEIQRRELEPGDPEIGKTVVQLVTVLNRAGRLDEAEAQIRESLAFMRASYPEGSFPLALSESMLGENLVAQGRFDEAEKLLLDSHAAIGASVADPSSFFNLDSYQRLISLYEGEGREADARPYRSELAAAIAGSRYFAPYSIVRRCFGPGLGPLVERMDRVNALCGDYMAFPVADGTIVAPELEDAVAELIAAVETDLEPDDVRRALLARGLLSWSRPLRPGAGDAARRRMLTEALRVLEPRANELPLQIAEAEAELARIAYAEGDLEEAERASRRALQLLAPPGQDAWFGATARARIGRSFMRQERFVEAERQLLAALATLTDSLGPDYSKTREARALLHELYTAWQKPAEAERYGAELPR